MALNALVEKLKRRSKDDFKGRHFEATLILQAVSWYLCYLLSSHSRGAPGWMKRLWWCGRQGDWFCLGVSEPVTEFDRRPFEHPLLSPGTVAGQLRSASVLEHVR